MTIVFDRYDNRLLIKATKREQRGYSGSQLATYQIHRNRQVSNYHNFLKKWAIRQALQTISQNTPRTIQPTIFHMENQ